MNNEETYIIGSSRGVTCIGRSPTTKLLDFGDNALDDADSVRIVETTTNSFMNGRVQLVDRVLMTRYSK